MKITGNEIRPGNIILHNGQLWIAVKTQHVQPGKGGAYLQVELKNLKTGGKLHERFRSSESVEKAEIFEDEYQYLYREGDNLTFMNQETFEQISVPASLLGDDIDFLQEGMQVKLANYEEEIVRASLPDTIKETVVEADPVVKGQTASSSYKPAKLSNGVKIMVPPHIEMGMSIIVNTADRTYVERAKD